MKNLFAIEVPLLYNPYDRDEILCNLETLAMCSYYLAGDDQMRLQEMVESELDTTIEAYNPEREYMKSYDALIEIIGGYNFLVRKHNLTEPLIKLVVDEEKTALLKEGSLYLIYKVVLCGVSDEEGQREMR